MSVMEDFFDQIILGALCCSLLLWFGPDPFAITAVLGSVVLACARPMGLPLWMRAFMHGAFLIVVVVLPVWALFLPVAVYTGMRERSWALRAAWILALIAVLVCGALDWRMACALCVLCAVAAVLAVRETRALADRASLRSMYDDLRESLIRVDGERSALLARAKSDALPSDAPADPALFAELTQRELAVARLVARGCDNAEIAAQLYLSEGTVRNHISAILQKKDLKNRTQLAVLYLRG